MSDFRVASRSFGLLSTNQVTSAGGVTPMPGSVGRGGGRNPPLAVHLELQQIRHTDDGQPVMDNGQAYDRYGYGDGGESELGKNDLTDSYFERDGKAGRDIEGDIGAGSGGIGIAARAEAMRREAVEEEQITDEDRASREFTRQI
jgi:hypothetical protein